MSAKLSQTYQHKDARTHIYDAPDTYIGAVEEDEKKGCFFVIFTPLSVL